MQAILNGEYSVVAPQPSRISKGKFQAICEAAIKEPEKNGEIKKKTTGLEVGIFGMIVNFIRPEASGDSAEKTKVSMCRDSDIQEITNGIAGILEGFGLLNFKTGEKELPEGLRKILEGAIAKMETLVNGTLPQEADTDTVPTENVLAGVLPEADAPARVQNAIAKESALPDEIAGMPKGKQEELVSLIAEYLCSFANTNKKGANEKTGAGAEKTWVSDALPVEPVPEKKTAGAVADRILTLLTAAVSEKDGVRTFKPVAKEPQPGSQPDAVVSEDTGKQAFAVPETQTAHRQPVNIHEAKQAGNTPLQADKADMADNLAKIVQKITSQVVQDEREFDVTLKPEFLGKLTIKLSIGSDGLKAQLKAADAAVKTLIANELPALTEMLKEKGLNVVKVDVTYDTPAFDASGQPYRENRENGSGHGKRYVSAAELPVFETAFENLAEPYLTLRNSSVEFTA